MSSRPRMGRTLVVVAVCPARGVSRCSLLAGASDLLTILGLAAATVAGVGAWANERSGARVRAALEEKRRGEMARANHACSQHKAEQQRAALTHERQLRMRTESARQAEREWSRELREQVLRMYKERGTARHLGPHVPELDWTSTSRGAKRGLLLAQRDEDGDGKLDLICGAWVQGRRGQQRDRAALRGQGDRERRRSSARTATAATAHAAADDEINSLVAIPVYMHDDFEGVVICANRPDGFEELDDDVLLSLGSHAGAVLENHRLHGRLRSSYLAVVGILADAIEAKDPFARASSDEVSACLEAVGRRARLRLRRLRAPRLRRRAARHRQARHLRPRAPETRPPERRGAQDRRAASADRLPHRRTRSGPGRSRPRDAPPPRALGRRRLPGAA